MVATNVAHSRMALSLANTYLYEIEENKFTARFIVFYFETKKKNTENGREL